MSNSKSISLSKQCFLQSFRHSHFFKHICLSHPFCSGKRNTTKHIQPLQPAAFSSLRTTHRTKRRSFSVRHPDQGTRPTRTRREEKQHNKVAFKCCCHYLGFYSALRTHRKARPFLLHLQANTFPFHFYCVYGTSKF